jgi:hypothetical protein
METKKRRKLNAAEQAEQQELAHSLDCLTASEWCTLTGITESTEEAHRKRGIAPPHIIIGNVVLYPRNDAKQFLLERVRGPRVVSARDKL